MPLCVLVVEDERLIRDLASEAFEEAGLRVVKAADGPSALRILNMPSCGLTGVMTDFHMPGGVDGAQVAHEARRLFPAIPVVITSGRHDVLQRRWEQELGYALLRKPFHLGEMVKIMRDLLASGTIRSVR